MPDDLPIQMLDIGPDELVEGADAMIKVGHTDRSGALYDAWFHAIPTGDACPTEAEFFTALVRLVAMPLEFQHCDQCSAIWTGRLALAAQRQAILHRQQVTIDQTALAMAQADPEVRDAMLEAMHVQVQ